MAAGEAPGKVILVGEHAVVYGRPAIAVPVWESRARATIAPRIPGAGCIIRSRDTQQALRLAAAGDQEPLALVTRLTLGKLGLESDPDWLIEVSSEIPIASGMGSGAAVSAALVRAIYAEAGVEPSPQTVSALVYAGEEIYHGTPSGIDNTVVAFGQPVWFVRGEEPQVFRAGRPFMLAIADSGIPSSTRAMVKGVRRRHDSDPKRYEAWFDEIGAIVQSARDAIEEGRPDVLGELFNHNQTVLVQIGVSTAGLEALVAAAREAGAGGAKLSGGGGGGNVIALVTEETAEAVTTRLLAAGARRVLVTTVAG